MADPAHTATDEILNRLERRLKREYTQAAREVQKKLDDYLAAFKIKDAEWQRRVAAGEATAKEYKNWRTGQMMMGKRWGQLQQECAENLANANQIAHSIAYGYQSEVYALNHNFATYEVEHSGRLDTAYTLYDKDTVARLMRDDPDMLPPPGKTVKERIAQGKDVLWNKQQLQSVMMQAIVQGDSIDKIAKRMSEAVATSDYKAAVRYARTMTTNTQNAGRYEGYRRAKGMGVDLTIEWSATLDNRTRHDHRLLHGQRREVDEPFEVDNVKILYPAQLGIGSSDIPQSMIWNCRCTLLAWVKGFEGETVKSSPKMGDMTFEEWQNMKEDDPRYKAERYKKGDQEQYADYKKLLGKDAPKSFGEFQQVKYNDPEKYAEWKKQAAAKRNAKKDGAEYRKLAGNKGGGGNNATVEHGTVETPQKAAPVFDITAKREPFASVEEAENELKRICDDNRFGHIGVSLHGLDVDVASRITHTLTGLFDEFGVEPFGGVVAPKGNTKLGKLVESAQAGYSPMRHSFLINRGRFGTAKKAQAGFDEDRKALESLLTHPERYDWSKMSSRLKSVVDGAKTSGRATVPETIEQALTHEFGHSLEKALKHDESYAEIVANMKTFAPTISGYATTEESEYIAESFCSFMSGEDRIDPVLKAAFMRLRRK